MSDEVHNEDPMIRTAELFSQTPESLATFFTGRELQVLNSNQRIRLTQVDAWKSEDIKPPFTTLRVQKPGTFYVQKFGANRLSFITVKSGDFQQGTCLAIKGAELYDETLGESGEFVPAKNQSQLASYIGSLGGEAGKIEYRNQTDTLFLTPKVGEIQTGSPTINAADTALQSLFDN